MTQEEKELLIKDICGRLPYGVQAQVYGHVNPLQILNITKLHKGTWVWKRGSYVVSFWNDTCSIETIKPFLRPMSSMTEEEINEFILISDTMLWLGDKRSTCILSLEQIDWLNKNMFDYRKLIEKGLALEAAAGMYT